MVFSSITFIFYFLPVTLLVYYLVPGKIRNAVLLFFSLFFYGFGEPVYILIMFASIFIDYFSGWMIKKSGADRKRAKSFLLISIFGNLGMLAFFKYFDFMAENLNLLLGTSIPLHGIALPIGISFFTFQTMSYTIDVYRKNTEAQKNIVTFGAYVTMFPQLIAGPIVIYRDVERQLVKRRITPEKTGEGIERFIIGLGKKVLFANTIGQLWEKIRILPPDSLPLLTAWLGVAAFSLQIYFDFSGYSDMAVGLGKMLGFDFLENFNYPFISRSITEFWRRWHMSLATWFRDYVYIPLGGNRRGNLMTLRNIGIVWFLTGFWHGAAWNYILWGIFFAVVLSLEKFVLKGFLSSAGGFLSRLYTLPVILLSFTIFALEDLGHLSGYLRAMFSAGQIYDATFLIQFSRYGAFLLILACSATPLPYRMFRQATRRSGIFPSILRGLTLFVIFILSVAFIVDGAYNPFLYFRF